MSDFALPGRHFPIEDRTHAEEALSGATRAYHAGNISLSELGAIRRKAIAKLAKKGK
ncbi:MAG TPA: hypothetical protein VFB14_14010 [Bryobacteraceae bacterium]|nr:hypothetical protein [Bryobacteraceae bacterium]